MDGLNAIQAKILSDAKEKVKEIALRAEHYKAEQIADAQDQKSVIIADMENAAKNQAEAMIKRAESLASMENRKSLLEDRQLLISEVIESALIKLSEKSDKEKVSLYRDLINAQNIKSGEITLSDKDKHIGKALVDCLEGDFSLSDQSGSFTGGVVIKRGRIEDNLTYDLVVRNQRPELSTLTASILFQEPGNLAEQ